MILVPGPPYAVGEVVVYRPRGKRDCYSPISRRWDRWPSPHWHPDPGMARRGDRMRIVKIDEVAGEQRLWYESPYATYGPAPAYASPGPGEHACHNVMAGDVVPSLGTTIVRCVRAAVARRRAAGRE
jgi:hypothetical protein